MYDGLLGVIEDISWAIWWLMPIPFVFFLVGAIKDAVTGGEHDISRGLAAAVCLLVMLAACVLN